MEWHYADGQEKRGPFSDAQIQELISIGKIQPATLVWNPTFTQWQAAKDAALFPSEPPDLTSRKCIITGKTFPVSLMIQTPHGWVSAEGKDRYYQSLRENAPLPTAQGMTNARRDGRKFVIPVSGGQLPRRCVKTGVPVQDSELKIKTLYWCTPWAAISILASILIYLVLYLVLRKKVVVEIPLSAGGRAILRKHVFITISLVGAGIGLVVWGASYFDTLVGLIFVGILCIVAGLIYGVLKGNALRVSKIANGEAWLSGASPEFLDQLPEY